MTNQTSWTIDMAHSEIAFKVRHLMITNVKGLFETFDARIYTSVKDFTTAQIDLWIDASSITTGDAKRDKHLRSPDFFDIENHKQIKFISSAIGKPNSKGDHELRGELTIKGITKNVKLNMRFGGIINDPWGNQRAGFAVTGKINRNDWGLNWNTAIEAGGLMVGEVVTISCEVELIMENKEALTMELETAVPKEAGL